MKYAVASLLVVVMASCGDDPDPDPACGDGQVDPEEACDDGNAETEACAYGEATCSVCDATCHTVAGTTSLCGDSAVDMMAGETCDDGNAVAELCAYGETICAICDASCHITTGATSYCGDTDIDVSAEACDDGNATTEACAYGLTSCSVCDATCQTVAGATAYCGDNATTIGETCDDGNATTEACTYGQLTCTVCNSTCHTGSGIASYCGDSATDATAGETCDDGNATTEACTYGQTSCTVCNSTCHSTTGATSYCGNSAIDAANGEQCDDGGTAVGDGCGATCQREACDSALAIDSTDAHDGARAIGLCDASVTQWSWRLPAGEGNPGTAAYDVGHGILGTFGPVTPREGGAVLVLSTGTARLPSDANYLTTLNRGYTSGYPSSSPQPYPGCPNQGTPHDGVALELRLRVPAWAHGFAFDYDFYTRDWPSACTIYNDAFVALVSPAPAGTIGGNVASGSGEQIAVTNPFLDVCDPAGTYGGIVFDCALGNGALTGTGFEGKGATGWLTSFVPADPNAVIILRLAVYDSYDGTVDSTALVDNFRWLATAPTLMTTRATCGDSVCGAGEDCGTCPGDCGACVCGDGACVGESCASCAADCGVCPFCGDGTCNNGETCTTCASDCGACPFCGDNVCNNGETCLDCAGDCGPCDCCSAHTSAGCDDSVVADCVCGQDSLCCSSDWSDTCAQEVTTFACGSCP